MSLKNPLRPQVELLEDRSVPAVTSSFFNGNLVIRGDNFANTLDLINQGDSIFKITNTRGGVTTSLGTFNLTGNVTLQMGNSNDTINIDLTAGGTLSGRILTVRGGNGNDVLNIEGGTIGSIVNVDMGNGNDIVNIGGVIGTAIGARAFIFNGGLGNDGFLAGNGSQFAGTLVLTRFNNIQFGDGENGVQALDVVVTNQGENTNNLAVFNPDALLAGNFTYVGGNLDDSVFLNGEIGGNATLVGNAGSNSLDMQDGILGGNLNYVGGNFEDNVIFNAGTQILGSAVLNMFNGENTYTLVDAFLVGGNMTIRSGGGVDDLTFGGQVDGNLDVDLGNGNNTFELIPSALIGGRLSYYGGAGVDTVTIDSTVAGDLRVYLGVGADVFSYGANTQVNSAYLDFGADFDNDTFNQNGAVVAWNQTLLNVP